jgi:DNA repair ATPase RecN
MVAKSVISQLQSVGEGALGKLAQSPATRTALKGAVQAKERGERLLHSLDSIETRLGQIEERLSALEKTKRRRSSPAASAPAAEPEPPEPSAGA